MSFAMTTRQVHDQEKTVTRRFGWWFLKPGDVVQPVEKGMGLKKGEKVEKVGGPIRVLSTRRERLYDMTDADCAREGFPEMTAQEFVDMLCDHYGCCSARVVNRIEFGYVDEPAATRRDRIDLAADNARTKLIADGYDTTRERDAAREYEARQR